MFSWFLLPLFGKIIELVLVKNDWSYSYCPVWQIV